MIYLTDLSKMAAQDSKSGTKIQSSKSFNVMDEMSISHSTDLEKKKLRLESFEVTSFLSV